MCDAEALELFVRVVVLLMLKHSWKERERERECKSPLVLKQGKVRKMLDNYVGRKAFGEPQVKKLNAVDKPIF